MKNLQEILLKCGGFGRLILGDEEIDIRIISSKSSIQKLDGYRDTNCDYHAEEDMICTILEVGILGNDFCRLAEAKTENDTQEGLFVEE